MRTVKEISESIIESYNNQETPNFVDLKDLKEIFGAGKEQAVNALISRYNAREAVTFADAEAIKKLSQRPSKWYVVNTQTHNGNSASIREEDTDLIVAEFPPVSMHEANQRTINLEALVTEHNKVIKALKS